VRWGRWSSDDELDGAVRALAAPSPGPASEPRPILLACTHGLHDVCCALRGRPVAAALAQEWPAETWECSHVGGDRFAANLVVLPDGVYYGNLDPGTAVETIRSHLAGTLSVPHLRGITTVSPPAQVAIAAVHERFGPFGARDVQEVAVTHTSPGVWRVQLAVPTARLTGIEVTVASSRRAPAQLTCRAGSDTPAAQYRVVGLVVG
jgi:(2Fe-2S) ferredoxin